jgi:hypothetical protein
MPNCAATAGATRRTSGVIAAKATTAASVEAEKVVRTGAVMVEAVVMPVPPSAGEATSKGAGGNFRERIRFQCPLAQRCAQIYVCLSSKVPLVFFLVIPIAGTPKQLRRRQNKRPDVQMNVGNSAMF